jgi:hypothetical protein
MPAFHLIETSGNCAKLNKKQDVLSGQQLKGIVLVPKGLQTGEYPRYELSFTLVDQTFKLVFAKDTGK